MKAWFPLLRARAAFLLAGAAVVAGALPLLCFAALVAWQIVTLLASGSWMRLPATLLIQSPSLLAAWDAPPAALWILDRLHVGLPFAVLGLLVMTVGVLAARRQKYAIRAEKQRREDRLRRVRDYLRDPSPTDRPDGRREPFIGEERRRVA